MHSMIHAAPSCSLVVLAFAAVSSAASPGSQLMPRPVEVVPGTGALSLENGLRVAGGGTSDPRLSRALGRFAERFGRQTGVFRPATEGATPATLTVRVTKAALGLPSIEMDESYALTVAPEGVTLTAPETWGALRGLETLLDLIEPGPGGLSLPAVTIKDRPRFRWRGLMIDSGRHFMPIDVLKRNLDGMAAVKLNVFHWHLTEDQGFRVESRRFPKLHQLGSDGLFYTQAQVKDVIAYAADRGIRVVPEFDMPGHTTSWFVGHPELATEARAYTVERKWGIMEPAMDPTREEVYRLLDGFIGEMAALFPDPVLHIGGDEVEGHAWDKSTAVSRVQEGQGPRDERRSPGLLQQAACADRDRPRQDHDGMGRDPAPGPPQGRDHPLLAGPRIAGQGRAAGLPRRALERPTTSTSSSRPPQHYAVEPLEKDAANLSPEASARASSGARPRCGVSS